MAGDIFPHADLAACAQVDVERWYPGIGGSARVAKAVCATCPVRRPCLEWALEHGEPDGVWGGKSVMERRKLAATRTTKHLPPAAA